MRAPAPSLWRVFSAYAEVVPRERAHLIFDESILRVRGGSSAWAEMGVGIDLYSPRTRR